MEPRRLWARVGLGLAVAALVVGSAASPWHPSGLERVTGAAPAAAQEVRRPNVLVVTADDMRADDLQWMPHVRHELVARGLSFRNSFTPNPLCCPARATFLTGRYSHNHHVLDVVRPYGFAAFNDSTTLATVLRRSGYRTGLVGKYLNGYGSMPTFHGRHPSLRYVPPGWTQWWASVTHHWRPGGPGGGTFNYFHLTSNVNGRIQSWPRRYTTNVTTAQTQSLVRRFGRVQPRRPWFIWWTPLAPHGGAPEESDDPRTTRMSNGEPLRWATPARPAWVRHRFARRITHGAGTPPGHPAERDVSDKPLYLRHLPLLTRRERRAETAVTRQRAQALYLLDRGIGHVLATLRRTEQAGRTIVVFNSDNGYYVGEHRKRQGKTTLHEPSIRVPLVMAGPGIPHGVRYDPASMADLAVTISSWAGCRLRRADGTDLQPTIVHGDHGWNRPIVIEGRMHQPRYLHGTVRRKAMGGLGTVGIRTGRYAYIRYSTGETELYDLLADPLQMTSLRGRTYRPLRRELLSVWQHVVGCARSTCRTQLPTDLRTSPQTTARIATAEEHARRTYYHY